MYTDIYVNKQIPMKVKTFDCAEGIRSAIYPFFENRFSNLVSLDIFTTSSRVKQTYYYETCKKIIIQRRRSFVKLRNKIKRSCQSL